MARARRHILFWAAYVLFKTYLNISDQEVSLREFGTVVLVQVLYLIPEIPLVYFGFFVIDRYLDMRWSLWKSTGILLAALLVTSVILTLFNKMFILPVFTDVKDLPPLSVSSMVYYAFVLLFVAGIATSIRLFRRQHQSKMREVVLQKEKTEAELKYLKAQINPHFLFNTLNNIYSLARKGSDQTAESILRLSKMMRFVLYEASSARIPLRDELMLIQDYIKLEELRYTNRLEVNYSENVDNPDQLIAPLLLIHFVENAFKHGVSESRAESFVNVNIELTKKVLKATIVNSKPREIKRNGTAIGMENVKKQLIILYPDHKLDVRSETHQHSVELTIPFTD